MEEKGIKVDISWNGLVYRSKRVYCVDDLVGKAREKALESVRAELYEWLEHYDIDAMVRRYTISEMFDGIAPEGCDDLKVEWSLSHAQGDGVRLVGRLWKSDSSVLQFPDLVDVVEFRTFSAYRHENAFDVTYMGCDLEGWYYDLGWSTPNDAGVFASDGLDVEKIKAQCKVFDAQVRALCVAVKNRAYDWMDGVTNAEAAEDYLSACDFPYRFDIDGKMLSNEWWACAE